MFTNEFILMRDKLNLIIQEAYKAGYDQGRSHECDEMKNGWDYANFITQRLIDEINNREMERIRKRQENELNSY